jgi:hypothetical protein
MAVAAIVAVAVVPELPVRQGYAGVLLGAVGMLVAVSLVGLDTPARDGRPARQWSLDGLGTVRGWRIIDNVPFTHGDVDHVVVAPAAVLAVQTTVRGREFRDPQVEGAGHRSDLAAAHRAARAVGAILHKHALPEAVVPVLAVRGPGAPELPDGHRLDGDVHVVDSEHPERWMHLFDTARLPVATRVAVLRDLESYMAKRADGDQQPGLPSELWHEFRGGIAHERATRRDRARALPRRHGLRLVPAPASATPAPAPAALAPAPAAQATAGTGIADASA